jgi:hypothetical protein
MYIAAAACSMLVPSDSRHARVGNPTWEQCIPDAVEIRLSKTACFKIAAMTQAGEPLITHLQAVKEGKTAAAGRLGHGQETVGDLIFWSARLRRRRKRIKPPAYCLATR